MEEIEKFESRIKDLIDEIEERFAKQKQQNIELLKLGEKTHLEIIDNLIKHNNVMRDVYCAKHPDLAPELKYMFYMVSVPLFECREQVIQGSKIEL